MRIFRLPNILSSHLVLNLRTHLHDLPTQSQLVRESFLGNIGGSIETPGLHFPFEGTPIDRPQNSLDGAEVGYIYLAPTRRSDRRAFFSSLTASFKIKQATNVGPSK